MEPRYYRITSINPKFEVYKIPFSDIERANVSLKDKDNTYSLSKHCIEQKWDIGVNGALFSNGAKGSDPYYYWNTTDMVINGVLNRGGNYTDIGLAFGNPWEGIGAYISTTGNSVRNKVDFIGGAPTLLVSGNVKLDMKGLSKSFGSDLNMRTAIGVNRSHLYILTTRQNKATITQVAYELQQQGCLDAINLDGGGSTAIKVGVDYYTQGRNIPSAFGIKLKDNTSSPVKRTLVAIDGGHNELTSGKQSPDGTYKEWEHNKDVSNRLIRHLNRHGIMTTYVDVVNQNPREELNKLVQIINSQTPDLLVSIHSNAESCTGFGNASGFELYAYDTKGKGYQLAKLIEKYCVDALGIRNRGVKIGSHLAVIRDTKMPAVLIEAGFHTNQGDLSLLKLDAFREREAVAYAKGILEYLGVAWKEETTTTKPSNVVYEVKTGTFSVKENAAKHRAELESLGYKPIIVEKEIK